MSDTDAGDYGEENYRFAYRRADAECDRLRAEIERLRALLRRYRILYPCNGSFAAAVDAALGDGGAPAGEPSR